VEVEEDAQWSARKEVENGHKYEVQRCKGIGRLANQRGKGGPLPVLLDRTFLEKLSFYFYYSHFHFLMPNSHSLRLPCSQLSHNTIINISPSSSKHPHSHPYLLSFLFWPSVPSHMVKLSHNPKKIKTLGAIDLPPPNLIINNYNLTKPIFQ